MQHLPVVPQGDTFCQGVPLKEEEEKDTGAVLYDIGACPTMVHGWCIQGPCIVRKENGFLQVPDKVVVNLGRVEDDWRLLNPLSTECVGDSQIHYDSGVPIQVYQHPKLVCGWEIDDASTVIIKNDIVHVPKISAVRAHVNQNIQTGGEKKKTMRLRLMTLNVDNVGISEKPENKEKFPNACWAIRGPKVAKLIQASNADIIVLQEMRDLPGHNFKQWLAGFGDVYEHTYSHHCGYPGAHGLIFLYRRNKFVLRATEQISFGGTPTDSLSVLIGRFYSLETQVEFHVATTQLSPKLDRREVAVAKLVEVMPHYQRCILAGDFNFFPTQKGDEHHERMLKVFDQDVGMPLADKDGNQFVGTFFGHGFDPYQSTFATMCLLDRIYVRGGWKKVGQAETLTSKAMLESGDLPSDHVDLIVNLEIECQPTPWH